MYVAKCDKCLWADQCYTAKNECSDYTPMDEYDNKEDVIEGGLYEFRRLWTVYTRNNGDEV